MNIVEKFLKTLQSYKLIKKRDFVIVGVSGGADSICLLSLLCMLRKKWKLQLQAVHINYKLRGEDADQDQSLVEEYCRRIKCDLSIFEYSKKPTTKITEENLRNFRYQQMEKLRKKFKANSIAVAHNKNDQAETMLMFLLRGSGLRGLSGIKYRQNKIIRPMLDIGKDEIYQYLHENKIKYREDASNLDPKYTRNKIRHELIPLLVKKYNPNLITTLNVNRKIIADDYSYIVQSAQKQFRRLAKCQNQQIEIDIKKFLKLGSALQREIIRLAFIKFNINLINISILDIEEMLRVIQAGREGAVRVIKGLRFEKKNGSMIVCKE